MNIRFLVLAFLLLISKNVLSQDLPEIIPPSPNTASLAKYGQIPVGLFTGTPNINIPLSTYKTKNLSIPISLNYSSNGIRVDELASHVGLGWSLNSGGAVSRTRRDDADEDATRLFVPSAALYSQTMGTFLNAATTDGSGALDTQPDLFSFSFNGYSGKFYLDQTLTPVLLSPSPVKIEFLNDVLDANPDVKITDPSGIVYLFGGGNATEESHNQSYNCGNHGVPSERTDTAWYLTKIVHPLGDEINLVYENYNNIYDSGISQTIVNATVGINPAVSASESTCISKVYTSTPILKEINSATSGKVVFSHTVGITGSENKKVDTVTVYDANNKLIKSYDFEYTVVNSNLTYLNPNPNVVTEASDKKRLFLNKVIEKGSNGEANPPYIFDYINPEQLPPRLSFAQDYWGYFNGASTNTHLINDIDDTHAFDNHNFISNRDPNGTYGEKGMLKKITYPTRGTNEIFYEPHSRYGIDVVNGTTVSESVTVESGDQYGSQTESFTLNNNVTEDVDIYSSVRYEYCNEFDQANYPSHWIVATMQVIDITNPSSPSALLFWTDPNVTPTTTSWSVPVFNASNPPPVPYVKLAAGRDYEFKITVTKPCLSAGFSFNRTLSSQTINTNIEVGGVRVAKTQIKDDLGNTEIKKYHYASLTDLTKSSGIGEKPRPQYFHSYDLIDQPSATRRDNYSLSSNTLHPLYAMQGYHIGYESVVESIGENFEGGGIETKFHAVLPPPPIIIISIDEISEVPGTPYTNIFGIGREKQKTAFRKNGSAYVTLSSKENFYSHNSALDNTMKVYDVRKKCTASSGLPCGNVTDQYYATSFYINQSNIDTEWHYLSSSIEKQYDLNGQNPVETITNYFYDNPDHLQVTRTHSVVSDAKPIITKTFYPDDVGSTSSLGNDVLSTQEKLAIDKLKKGSLHHIAMPIQVETYKDLNNDGNTESAELINRQRTIYKEWFTDIILPEYVQTSKNDVSFNDRIQFQDYYNNGNLEGVSKSDGTHSYYIWGYNEQYPIAKIDNFTSAQAASIQTQITSAINASNADVDRTIGASGTEGTLRTALDVIRNNTLLTNAMVTSYTYDPLIGVTSTTDPGGYTSYYVYNQFNRLRYVKNKDGEVLSENKYHYKVEDILASTTSTSYSVNSGQSITLTTVASGGTGNFTYKWTVSNSNLNQVFNTSSGTLNITTTANHAPSFTITCEVKDTQTNETMTTTTQVNVSVSYPALVVNNITFSPGGANYVGKSIAYSIVVTGGSGNYKYEWSKTNDQNTYNYTNNTSSLTKSIVSSDCDEFTIRCKVTDLTTNEIITKTRLMFAGSGCFN
ncbi:hypothetical protein [Jejuia spongiicola]|uniref:Ig-like domain-containing protein n=1 Tax=Jejuia spongiicola TaxID=2942207 RepID=A0ABT0QEW0_9FLAO|nr:hypothetical protein [Jejuia spongiicola]MCL6295530.1 hypothetical protein [Jejuia spongiicola]